MGIRKHENIPTREEKCEGGSGHLIIAEPQARVSILPHGHFKWKIHRKFDAHDSFVNDRFISVRIRVFDQWLWRFSAD